MPTLRNKPASHEEPDWAQSAWQRIRTQLESARSLIISEISHYPAPRPACDADFNHLLEERARISEELNRLHAAVNTAPANVRQQIEDFISTSNYLDDAGRHQVRSMISELPR